MCDWGWRAGAGEHTLKSSISQVRRAYDFPSRPRERRPEAVLLNTAGGLTGGDRMKFEMVLGHGAEGTIATAAAEKIYRARDDDPSVIEVKLRLGASSRLAWLPQPTILFDGSRLERRTEVQLADDATFVGVEILIFGRKAMGEDVRFGSCTMPGASAGTRPLYSQIHSVSAATSPQRWTVRPRSSGTRAVATLIFVATDAAARLAALRAKLEQAKCVAGASAWNGVLVVRAFAPEGRTLQDDLAPLVRDLTGRPLPRVWQC